MKVRATAVFWLLDWEGSVDRSGRPPRGRGGRDRAPPDGTSEIDRALAADVAAFRRLLRLLDEGLVLAKATGNPAAVRFYEDLALEVFRIIRASKS